MAKLNINSECKVEFRNGSKTEAKFLAPENPNGGELAVVNLQVIQRIVSNIRRVDIQVIISNIQKDISGMRSMEDLQEYMTNELNYIETIQLIEETLK